LSLARFIEGLIGMIPILYHGPFFTVYSYGLMVALGFILATAGLVRQARREGLDSGRVYDFCFVLLIAGILGARIFYVVLNWSDFNDRLLDIVKINQGGLVWFGGLLGAFLAGVLFIRRQQWSFVRMADLTAPWIALGQAVGRVGCFLNGCCYGFRTPHGLYFPVLGDCYFPSQIVDALTLGAVFLILYRAQRRSTTGGRVFALYLVAAGLQRFGMEILRGDVRPFYFGLSIFQWIALGVVAAGMGLLWRIARHH
jgi:phosphatidylglycerol:prolipoprotein diacylglycerol transferase